MTKFQKQILEFYVRHRDQNPTVLGMIIFSAKRYVLSLVLFAVIIVIEYMAIGYWAASLLIALCVGAFARDIGHFRNLVRSWPLTKEIIDWNKVDSL